MDSIKDYYHWPIMCTVDVAVDAVCLCGCRILYFPAFTPPYPGFLLSYSNSFILL